ncbi:MAG: hypothetical protein IBJ15_00365 [Alphaproteobacteria bacterium]|nr:hypothetical protein [Alphaproteobacteria bacterium]
MAKATKARGTPAAVMDPRPCVAVTFDGWITLRAPYTTTPPDIPKNTMPRMAVMVDVAGARVPRSTLYMPGSQIRSGFRVAAAEVVSQTLADRDAAQLWTLFDWYYNTSSRAPGAAVARQDIDGTIARRALNPIIGLFGDFGLRGAAGVEAAIPSEPYDPLSETLRRGFSGVRFDGVRAAPAILEGLAPGSRDDWAKLAATQGDRSTMRADVKSLEREKRAIKREATKEKREFSEAEKARSAAIDVELSTLAGGIAALSKEAGAEASTSHLIAPIEYLPAGMVLTHRMTLLAPTALELDLFLAAINRFFEGEARLGARAALGFGSFEANWTVKRKTAIGMPIETLGAIHGRPFEGTVIEALSEPRDNPLAAGPVGYGAVLRRFAEDPSRYDFSVPAVAAKSPAASAA